MAIIFAGMVFAKFRPVRGTALKQTSLSPACPIVQKTRPIPEKRKGVAAASINLGGQDFIYAVGGQDSLGRVTNTVFYTKVLPYGPIEKWMTKNDAFEDVVFNDSALASTHGRLYILGGDDGGTSINSVYQTQPQPETGDTTWLPTTPLAIPVYLHTAVPLGDRIYVIGGYRYEPPIFHAIADVFSARILGSGDLSEWEPESSLSSLAPDGISAHAAVASEDHQCIYVIGGCLGSYSPLNPHKKVFKACIEGSGKLGAWEEESEALPLVSPGAVGIYYHSAAIVDDRVFVIGGTTYESG